MTRWLAFGFVLAIPLTTLFAASQLPESDGDDSFEIEPPLLIPNRDNENPPPEFVDASAAPVPAIDSDKLEKNLERAKKSAASAERLFKIGVLSKAEAENRALRVLRLHSDLQNARLAQARQNLAEKKSRFAAGEVPKEELAEAEAIEKEATAKAQAAVADRERAELVAAETNLKRQQKLLALGSGHKSDVTRAAEKLAELKTPKNE